MGPARSARASRRTALENGTTELGRTACSPQSRMIVSSSSYSRWVTGARPATKRKPAYRPNGHGLNVLGQQVRLLGLADDVPESHLVVGHALKAAEALDRVLLDQRVRLDFNGMQGSPVLDGQVDLALPGVAAEPHVAQVRSWQTRSTPTRASSSRRYPAHAMRSRSRSWEVTVLLEVDDICKTFPGHERPILEHVTFSVGEGERIGIVGDSGSGKSTLARIVAGLETADSGSFAGYRAMA